MGYPSPPLDRQTQSIRLCTFQWQEGKEMGHEDIAVSLTAVDINDPACPPWISLSYTWGNFEDYREQDSGTFDTKIMPMISLNGVATPITLNLWRGLDAILQSEDNRSSGKLPEWTATQYFWIDAICINQADMDERSHQVSLMGLIYSRTAGVIVYLAPDIADENELHSWLDAWDAYIDESEEATILPEDVACVAKPFINPYWTRIWIVQEVLLAPNIIWLYEKLWLHAEQLQFIGQKPGLGMTAPTRLLESRVAFQSGEPLDVPTLLETYQENRCSEPKDRLYGLLGVLPPDYGLEVNYKISNTDLFFQVMHLERHMPKYLYNMYRLAQNLQKALELGTELTYLVIVATVMYYEVQEAKGLLRTMDRPLDEHDVSTWLVSTSEGQDFLKGELRAPPEAFGAKLGYESRFIPWNEHDVERLAEICPFPRNILTRNLVPQSSWFQRLIGTLSVQKAVAEPWRLKLHERDNKARRQHLWIEQHSITRNLQRLTVSPSCYREMGKLDSTSTGGELKIETLYMSSSTPFMRRQGSRDDMWNSHTTMGAIIFGPSDSS